MEFIRFCGGPAYGPNGAEMCGLGGSDYLLCL